MSARELELEDGDDDDDDKHKREKGKVEKEKGKDHDNALGEHFFVCDSVEGSYAVHAHNPRKTSGTHAEREREENPHQVAESVQA